MIPLPPPAEPATTLVAALRSRRSRYSYGPLSRQDLGTLLGLAVGVQRHVPPHVLGMNPTAGGLPSLAVHVVVDGEVFEYLREPHALCRTGTADLAGVFAQDGFAERARAAVVLTGRMGPGLAKYGPRHYRTVHLDAGVAVQNLYLVATAVGLRCCAVAGFADDAVKALVRGGEEDVPLALFVVGGTPRPVPAPEK
ncbi:SagB/ThcOx family dehydrogenase [Saccharothrix australiensis]|uniref:SagB-type dehydrogenase family enzyme n=1 Tax=Saccharothrix australiensis TaxID=2072 RepID=A0A495W4Z8_9PSEU|nr:SagB/ThcOx family dehydrogenase [Saccharothrix australiensis]RKT55855.1 SagB-type dehydrogenase family enzyme [Saccharothrix australiensis]